MALPHSSIETPPSRFNKVPEVTVLFWFVKMMSTTVGETAADFLNADMGFGLTNTTIAVGILLAMALSAQIVLKRLVPSVYWLSVLLISVSGTLITDNLTDQLGVPLWATSLVFALALTAIFYLWHRKEGTLSITEIDSRPRELFYWAAILATFALGTAAGDWVAEGFKLGYAYAALAFGGLIAATAVARFVFHVNAVLAFWIAYILTRPFGAACGDLLAQTRAQGGIGFGTTATTAIFVATIVGLVLYLSLTHKQSGAR